VAAGVGDGDSQAGGRADPLQWLAAGRLSRLAGRDGGEDDRVERHEGQADAGADEQQWGRAAEILGVAPAFLRSLDTAGLIAPQRTRQLSCGVSSLPSDQQGASNRTRGNRP
jgi:hypothetical protein